jgi:hypothetical protein
VNRRPAKLTSTIHIGASLSMTKTIESVTQKRN